MSIDLPGLIDSYGYLAVLIGAFLEGETILALAGLAAYRQDLDFTMVVVVALLAGFAGDQFYFFLGRRKGSQILQRFPGAHERAIRFDEMLSRWHAPLIVAIRFMYGFRIVGPVLLGMGRVPAWKFMLYNFIGACIWAPLIAGLGYLFGNIIETLIADLKNFELWAFGALIAIGVGSFVVHHIRSRRNGSGAHGHGTSPQRTGGTQR
ncbi:MAG TPA: DedA family protein [Usitatibacter sp.]|nr:DedA family protein [Usitatibacter sp.]